MAAQQREYVVGPRGVADAHEFDLPELVHPDQSFGVPAVGAGLGAEARRVSGVGEWEVLGA